MKRCSTERRAEDTEAQHTVNNIVVDNDKEKEAEHYLSLVFHYRKILFWRKKAEKYT